MNENCCDLSMLVPGISKMVNQKHKEFRKKYLTDINKVLAEDEISRKRIRAKLKLIADVFLRTDVIDQIEDVDLCSKDENFSGSLAIGYSPISPFPVYLLNTGSDAIITTRPAFPTIGLELKFLLGTSEGEDKKFHNVLCDEFDWMDFSETLLRTIHSYIYRRGKVMLMHAERMIK